MRKPGRKKSAHAMRSRPRGARAEGFLNEEPRKPGEKTADGTRRCDVACGSGSRGSATPQAGSSGIACLKGIFSCLPAFLIVDGDLLILLR